MAITRAKGGFIQVQERPADSGAASMAGAATGFKTASGQRQESRPAAPDPVDKPCRAAGNQLDQGETYYCERNASHGHGVTQGPLDNQGQKTPGEDRGTELNQPANAARPSGTVLEGLG